MWFRSSGTSGVIDPGPGSLVQICASNPTLDATTLETILLTHRHLDHSTDINILAEAMTDGGHNKRGTIRLPRDASDGDDPVLLKYTKKGVARVQNFEDHDRFNLGGALTVQPIPLRHHGVACYGLVFRSPHQPAWGVISDTHPFEELASQYIDCEFVSINVTLKDRIPHLDHFSLPDLADLLLELRPKLLAVTHMGTGILRSDPDDLAARLSTRHTHVVAARDGMVVDLDRIDIAR